MAFKRASLTGSAQLFQPTRVPTGQGGAVPEPLPLRPRSAVPPLLDEISDEEDRGAMRAPAEAPAHGHLYRLSEQDVEVLLEALQHAKFPHSYQRMAKPAMEDFEQLEALRQKIVEQREARG